MPKKKKKLTPKEKEKPYNPEDVLRRYDEEGGETGLPPAGHEGGLPRDTTDDFPTEIEREAFKGKRK